MDIKVLANNIFYVVFFFHFVNKIKNKKCCNKKIKIIFDKRQKIDIKLAILEPNFSYYEVSVWKCGCTCVFKKF